MAMDEKETGRQAEGERVMKTYSHGLITAVLRRKIPQSEAAALLAGSVAPDLPLGLLTVGYELDRG